jgi:hypothetical protein
MAEYSNKLYMKHNQKQDADKTLYKLITDWTSTQIDIQWLRQLVGGPHYDSLIEGPSIIISEII